MTEAVDGLLQAVLSGEWPVPASLAWALSPGSPALPAELQRRLLQRSAERDTAEEGGAPTPAAFRLAVLSRVRDQAELILAAAEAAAGPSRPGTPQHHGTHPAAGPPHPAGRGAAAAGGLEARLHRVARRLEPGAVDDLNFPTLGGCPPAKPSTLPPPAAPQGGEPQAAGALGGGGGGATPRIRPAAAAPLRAPRRAAGGGGEGESGGATPRRRIVPTQVPAVEASEPFLDTALTPQRPDVEGIEDLLQRRTPGGRAGGATPGGGGGGRGDLNEGATDEAAAWQGRLPFEDLSPSRPVAPAFGAEGPSGAQDGPGSFGAPGGPAPPPPPAAAQALERRLAAVSLGSDYVEACASEAAAAAPVAAPAAAPAGPPPPRGGRRRLAPEPLLPASKAASPAKPSLSPQKRPAAGALEPPLAPPAAGAAPAPPPAAPPPAALGAPAAALAELHAGLLRAWTGISLSGEVELLLNLLAVPASVRIITITDPAAPAAPAAPALLWCGALAQAFAAAVLLQAGGLLRGLGPQLLEDLAAAPAAAPPAAGGAPGLGAAAGEALAALRARQRRSEKAYNQVVAPEGALGLHGLAAFTSDGRKSRTPEEQRRIGNREACRDAWFALMRDAAAQHTTFSPPLPGGAGGGQPGAPSSASGGGGAALAALQRSASDLLRGLRPDNFGAFAELFTAAVLQAAATGEAVPDQELAALARRDLSRFHSLNQRMQGKGAAGPSRGGAARMQRNQPGAAPGFAPPGPPPAAQQQQQQSSSQQQRWPGAGAGVGPAAATRPRGGGKAGGGGAAAAGEEAATAAAELMAEFPRSLRLYVLFLEAADSHRLNVNLVRCMTARLRALAAPPAAAGDAATLGDRVVATTTLAAFLGYLAFTRGGASSAPPADGERDGGGGGAAGAPPRYDGTHPVDVAAALAAARAGGGLPRTLPWAARYLRFARWDPGAARSPYFAAAAAQLAALRAAPALAPGGPHFGPAAFCLRALLDDFAERAGPDAAGGGAPGGPDSGGGAGEADGDAELAAALAAADPLVDSRYIQLCCPALAHARHLFRGNGGGGGTAGYPQPRAPKKIRPTAPAAAAPAARLALQLPTAVAAAREGAHDAVRLRLQRAFLEQYSSEDAGVKLKEVVEYVADVIACNAAASCAAAAAPPAVEAAGAALAEGVQARAALGPVPEAALRQYAAAAAEQAIRDTCEEVLRAAYAAAQGRIRRDAARAMAALCAPELGGSVVATAAAIAAGAAEAACAERLIASVQGSVRGALARHADAAVMAALKARAKVAAAAAEGGGSVPAAAGAPAKAGGAAAAAGGTGAGL